jgi:hypothetical protein
VLRGGSSQAGLKGSDGGHRDAGGLLDLTGPKKDMPKVVGAGRQQQRGLRLLNGREGALGGDPGQFRLAHLGQRLRADVVGLREDAEGAAPVVAGQLTRRALGVADEPGEQQAGLFVVGGLVEAVRLVGVALQARQDPDRAIAHGDAERRGDHLVVGQRRSQRGDGAELDATVGRQRQRLSDEILHRDPEHLREPDEHRHPVDVADAALDLTQPGFGPADHVGQRELGQTTPTALDGDALADRHVVHGLVHGAAPSALAAGPDPGIPCGDHPVASCARLTSSRISSHEGIRASRGADSSNSTRTPHSRSWRRLARNVG